MLMPRAACCEEEAGAEEDQLQTVTRILVGFAVQVLAKIIRKRRNAKRALKKVRRLERKDKEIPEELLARVGKLKKREDKKEARKKKKEAKKKHHLLFWLLVVLIVVVILKARG